MKRLNLNETMKETRQKNNEKKNEKKICQKKKHNTKHKHTLYKKQADGGDSRSLSDC